MTFESPSTPFYDADMQSALCLALSKVGPIKGEDPGVFCRGFNAGFAAAFYQARSVTSAERVMPVELDLHDALSDAQRRLDNAVNIMLFAIGITFVCMLATYLITGSF